MRNRAYKPSGLFSFAALIFALCFFSAEGAAPDAVRARIESAGEQATLHWNSSIRLPFATSYAEYFIHQSSDLENWSVIAGPIRGEQGVGNEAARIGLGPRGQDSFYRISYRSQLGEAKPDGAGMLGFSETFSRELQEVGMLPLEAFVQRYSEAEPFLGAITFDPTTADFWTQFNSDPVVFNATNTTPARRYTDFRLNAAEFALFRTNGLVVSPRLGGYSFADVFYKVYTDDLPVFISTDAMLHAWHRTYVAMLSEIEETYLAPKLLQVVDAMTQAIPALAAEAAGTSLEPGVRHADLYLTVARNLLTETYSSGSLGQGMEIGGQMSRIQALLPAPTALFGDQRVIDYSQFAVRGHYSLSPALSRYFRAVMWLGLVDLRIVEPRVEVIRGAPFPRVERVHWEFAGIAALNTLLDRAGMRNSWGEINSLISHLVGLPDAADFSQIDPVLRAVNFAPPYDQLRAAFDLVMAGEIGAQEILGGPAQSPFSPEQLKLPRSFAFIPRRFIIDSWALSKSVFDRIWWDEDGIPSVSDKVQRRIPSSLDVAFAALGNNQVVPLLAARISGASGERWRDGYPYHHNLAAVRNTIDAQPNEIWSLNVYSSWLKCLRALSGQTTDPRFPDVMRTRAWAMKTVNTQLASWTQLRHDNILYGEQSYTPQLGCSYPKSFVEPRIEFWEAMRQMAVKHRSIIETIPVLQVPPTQVPFNEIQPRRLAALDNFIATLSRLRDISQKELNGAELTEDEIIFLEESMERRADYGIGERSYSGWYPNLFYRNIRQWFPYGTNQGADYWDALVTDVHTAVPDPDFGFPGMVLHQGVGNIHLAMIAVNCRDGSKNIYAGPVLSYYEFQRGPTTRLSDAAWKAQIRSAGLPPSPDWTGSFLVPGVYTVPELPTGF